MIQESDYLSMGGTVRSTKAASLILVIFVIILFQVTAVHAAPTLFYVDPDFTRTPRDVSAAKPWQSLSDTGAWAAIDSALAAGTVTVYFSARNADSDPNQA